MKPIGQIIQEYEKIEKDKIFKQIESALIIQLRFSSTSLKFPIFVIDTKTDETPSMIFLFERYYGITKNIAKKVIEDVEKNYELLVEKYDKLGLRGFSVFITPKGIQNDKETNAGDSD